MSLTGTIQPCGGDTTVVMGKPTVVLAAALGRFGSLQSFAAPARPTVAANGAFADDAAICD